MREHEREKERQLDAQMELDRRQAVEMYEVQRPRPASAPCHSRLLALLPADIYQGHPLCPHHLHDLQLYAQHCLA